MVMAIIISVMLLFVGIAILITIHVCVVGRAFRGDRSMNERSSSPIRLDIVESMNPEDIKGLSCFDYKVDDENANYVECAVCLENFKGGEKCRILPNCNHCFHSQCIDPWLLKTAACPICRTPAKSPQFGGLQLL